MDFQIIRKVIVTGCMGLSISLLVGGSSAWAQNPTVAAPVPAVATTKAATPPTVSAEMLRGQATEYTVSPEDLLDVFVMDVQDISRTYRVGANGSLTLPLLSEPIPAAGLTLEQLSHVIATRLHDAGMVSNAQVMVTLKETRLHTVTVSGEVKNPRAFPVFGPTRLMDILTQAGGLTDTASGDAIITRGEIGARADAAVSGPPGGAGVAAKGASFTLNIGKLIETGDDKANILLYSGDRVTVKKADMIYILGAVGRPGAYIPRDPQSQLSVLRALALAGDATSIARKNKMIILRKDPLAPQAPPKSIPVDYKAMLRGQVADLMLQPNDILFVPESGKTKFLRSSSVLANQFLLTGTEVAVFHY
jgi:polysaccharide export outer membrane protein